MSTTPTLARRLGLLDATAIGVGSMVGAGVFAVWGPATSSAGRWLLLALLVAAIVAFANATSSAQLAAVYPVAGGTYVYGREVLGPWWGHAAGWSFVIGKTASCAAMAITFAAYVLPGEGSGTSRRLLAAAVVAVLAGINCLGVTRTALLTKVIVTVVLAVLAWTAVAGTTIPTLLERPGDRVPAPDASWYGVLQGAALLFFAFAGYARIATMGEEVTNPRRTIPRAIVIALGVVLAVYLLIGVVVLRVLGGTAVGSDQPLVLVARAAQYRELEVALGVAAALATAGALLNLMTGIGRTSLAMAREGDFPRWLSAVHPRTKVPHRAELVLGAVVIAVVLAVDLRGAIGFSSFGVLLYYSVANLSALRQPDDQRRYPRWLQVLGVVGCLTLVATLPWRVLAVGVVVLAIGLGVRAVVQRRPRAA
ncbi:APC family permease [Aestuariimicrobium ganziense]|uniref:APC family permease n=1 Tax=Aestuariimicrobium ganziense TaxID=2773677 RepID=UPI001942EF39|nr:APC family permease [Aestuariimicrobium ganziense]